jgi:hypothetical protein
MGTLANAALQQDPNPIDTIISEGHLVTDPKKIRTQKSCKRDKKNTIRFCYFLSYTHN